MNLRQAAQQALEAWFRPHGINYVDFRPYMEALRAALAEPEQEPDGISWLKRDSGYFTAPTPHKPLSEQQRIDLVRACGFPKFNDWHDAAIGVTHSVERAHGIGEQHE